MDRITIHDPEFEKVLAEASEELSDAIVEYAYAHEQDIPWTLDEINEEALFNTRLFSACHGLCGQETIDELMAYIDLEDEMY